MLNIPNAERDEQIKDKGYNEGYASGYDDGYALAWAEIAEQETETEDENNEKQLAERGKRVKKLFKKEREVKMYDFKKGDKVVMLSSSAWWEKGDLGIVLGYEGCPKGLILVSVLNKPSARWRVSLQDVKKYVKELPKKTTEKNHRTGIVIKTEESGDGIEVLELHALKFAQLPKEYTSQGGAVWLTDKGYALVQNPKYFCLVPLPLLTVGRYYLTRKEFFDTLQMIKKAGKMLMEVNQKLKQLGMKHTYKI